MTPICYLACNTQEGTGMTICEQHDHRPSCGASYTGKQSALLPKVPCPNLSLNTNFFLNFF